MCKIDRVPIKNNQINIFSSRKYKATSTLTDFIYHRDKKIIISDWNRKNLTYSTVKQKF